MILKTLERKEPRARAQSLSLRIACFLSLLCAQADPREAGRRERDERERRRTFDSREEEERGVGVKLLEVRTNEDEGSSFLTFFLPLLSDHLHNPLTGWSHLLYSSLVYLSSLSMDPSRTTEKKSRWDHFLQNEKTRRSFPLPFRLFGSSFRALASPHQSSQDLSHPSKGELWVFGS